MLLRTARSDSAVNAVWRLLVRLSLIAVVLYAGYRLRAIIATIFIGTIIAYVLDPMVEWLSRRAAFIRFHTSCSNAAVRFQAWYRSTFRRDQTSPSLQKQLKRHVVRTYATLYVFVLSVIVVWYGANLVIKPFSDQISALQSPIGQKEMKDNWERFRTDYDRKAPAWAKLEKVQKWVVESDATKNMQHVVADLGQRVLFSLKYVVEIVLLPVLAFYFLIDSHKLKKEFVGLVPRRKMREVLRVLREFNLIMRSFIIGQFILCILAGVVVGIGLFFLNVRYPLLLGLLAGLTRAIPIVGPIIGGIPIILLTLVDKGVPVALAVLGFFTFLHFAESKFVMPVLIGDRMDLHPVVIIVVLIVGGEVGGMLIGGPIGSLLGMFFAAPVAAIVRILVRRYWLHIHEPPHHHNTAHTLASAPTKTGVLPIPNSVMSEE